MPPTTQADAVLIAPDRCTIYLQSTIEAALARLESDAVLEVPCELDTRSSSPSGVCPPATGSPTVRTLDGRPPAHPQSWDDRLV